MTRSAIFVVALLAVAVFALSADAAHIEFVEEARNQTMTVFRDPSCRRPTCEVVQHFAWIFAPYFFEDGCFAVACYETIGIGALLTTVSAAYGVNTMLPFLMRKTTTGGSTRSRYARLFSLRNTVICYLAWSISYVLRQYWVLITVGDGVPFSQFTEGGKALWPLRILINGVLSHLTYFNWVVLTLIMFLLQWSYLVREIEPTVGTVLWYVAVIFGVVAEICLVGGGIGVYLAAAGYTSYFIDAGRGGTILDVMGQTTIIIRWLGLTLVSTVGLRLLRTMKVFKDTDARRGVVFRHAARQLLFMCAINTLLTDTLFYYPRSIIWWAFGVNFLTLEPNWWYWGADLIAYTFSVSLYMLAMGAVLPPPSQAVLKAASDEAKAAEELARGKEDFDDE